MMIQDRSYYASHYKDVCRIALRAGEVMASHGAEAYRIEDTVCRILKTTGFSYAEAHVSVTGLTISLSDESLDREVTLIKRTQNRGSDLSQISLCNDISRRFVEGHLSIEEAWNELEKLHGLRNYPRWISLLAYGFTSSLFTLMFGGNLIDSLTAFPIGLVVGLVSFFLGKLKIGGFMHDFICSVSIGVSFILLIGLAKNPGPILSGSIMPLVPGMLLTVAIRDLLKGDYMSGLSRGIEAVITAVSIAAGVAVVLHMFEASHGPISLTVPDRSMAFPLWILLQVIYAFTSTISFIILFNAEPKHLLHCGVCGALTWFVYCLLIDGTGYGISIFVAAFAASLIAVLLSRHDKAPVTIFFTGGILCLVPGAGIFRTMYYMVGRQIIEGSDQLLLTLETAGLIAIAMAIAMAVLAPFFRRERAIKKISR
ncbi:MAG: threonine/serine exporter family protein [Firmicutes bacterium]|nr:threonine/serine exporter family protein [Bacillota bacterium]